MKPRPIGTLAIVVATTLALGSLAGAQSPDPSPSIAPTTAPSAAASPGPTPTGSAAPTDGPSAAPASPVASAPVRSPAATPSTTDGGSPSPDASLSPAQQRIPPEVLGAANEWPLPNQDYAGRRRADGSGIDRSTIDRLGIAWTVPISDQSEYGYGAFATNPLIIDGRVYIQDLTSDIHVYDLATGEVIWETPEWDQPQLGPNGVAVGYGRVYAVKGEHEVVALSMEDGSEVWRTDVRTQNDTEGVTIQPIVYDGRVFLSTVPGSNVSNFYQGGVSGLLLALDAESGEVIWSFDTDASGNLWGNEEVNSGGGAWYPPTIDIRDRTTFWGIGNPAPYPGTEEFPAGSSRPGRNLYTDSVVALEPDGDLDWFRQVRPGDLFDLDFQLPPILASVEIEGQQRAIVLGGGKNGEIVAMRRDNGRILWRTAVGRHENDDVRDIPEEGITVFPGTLGGIETPMAFVEGVVYAPYLDVSTTYSPTSILSVGLDDDAGGVVAVDASTGEILWDTPYDSMVLGAVTVINDLLLTSTYDGRILFLDRATGEEVASWQSPAGINGWPAVAGDTVLVPAGVGATPMLIALRLDAEGVMPSPQPSASPAPSPAVTPALSPAVTPEPSPAVTPMPSPSAAPIASPSSPAASPGGSPVAGIELEVATTAAAPLSFSTTELAAPAATEVTVTYDNQAPVPHNIAFYAGSGATAPLIAATPPETGPVVQELTFTTPADAGSYLFRCDVHPGTMIGTLIVS